MEEEVGGVKMKMNKLRDELRKAKKETEKYKESQTTNVSSKSSDEPSTAEVCLILPFSLVFGLTNKNRIEIIEMQYV